MRILITGGGGFQGSHLAESLIGKGHVVTILTTYSERSLKNIAAFKDKLTIVWGSITDKEAVDKTVRDHDVVFHLAAHINVDESLHDPVVFFYANILGTYYVLEAVRKYGNRLIYTSTCEVYGDGHNFKKDESLNESAELRPNSPYAASKAAADRVCHSYFKSFGLDVTIVRPFNVYGERQKNEKFGALVPILVTKALRGENLTVFGDGRATRDYTHVSDIVAGYNIVLENRSLKGAVVNFASGENIRVGDIAKYIAKKLGVSVVYGPARPGEVSRFPADVSFAHSLGYAPRVSMWEGLDRYIAWAQENSGK